MRKYISILLLLVSPVTAIADPMKYLPQWQDCTVDGHQMACYDLEGARKLKLADIDLDKTYTLADGYAKSIDLLKLTNTDLQNALDSAQDAKKKAMTLYDVTAKQRDEEIAARVKAEQRDILGGGFPWIVVTGVASFSLGVIVVAIVVKH